jgi:Ca-activated chloride channel family protein
MPVGGTAIGRALVASKRLLESAQKPGQAAPDEEQQPARLVLLLTDGEDHEGDPVTAARELKQAGVRVVVVGIGSATGEPIPTYAADGTWTGYLRDDRGDPILSALTTDNEAQLKQIANVSEGRYFRARQGSVGVDEIRLLMRKMKQAEHKARKISIAEDRYAWVLLPAFLLLLLEALLPEAWYVVRKNGSAKKEAT